MQQTQSQLKTTAEFAEESEFHGIKQITRKENGYVSINTNTTS